MGRSFASLRGRSTLNLESITLHDLIARLTECQTSAAWSTESGGCRECRTKRKKRPHDLTPRADRMGRRKQMRRASLVGNLGSSLALPCWHNHAFANPRNERICLASRTQTSHRPSCRATERDFHVHSKLGKASMSHNLWCKFCSPQLLRWWAGSTYLSCPPGSKDRERFHRASSTRSVNEQTKNFEVEKQNTRPDRLTSRPSNCFCSSLYRINFTVLSLDPVAMRSPCGDQAMQYIDPLWCFVRLNNTVAWYVECSSLRKESHDEVSGASGASSTHLISDNCGYSQILNVFELLPIA